MSADDTADLKTFIASLPEHDLLFLSRDITHPKVIEAWIAAIPEGRITSIVAGERSYPLLCAARVSAGLVEADRRSLDNTSFSGGSFFWRDRASR